MMKKKFDYELRDAENRRVVAELRKVGVSISDIYDLVYTDDRYPDSIPVLIALLPTIREFVIKDGVVRALTTKEARGLAERPLLREFLEEPAEQNCKWAIGNALKYLAKEDMYDDIVRIVKDRSHGTSRQELVAWLGKMKNKQPGVVKLLIQLLKDDDVIAHALEALRRLKAVDARPHVEPLLKHPRPLVRREAAKTLKVFDTVDD